MQIDIRQLEYLCTIVDENCNVTRASEALYVSQPALSKMIGNIEREGRVRLFERSGGRLVGLTDTGERFIRQARIVLREYGHLLDTLDNSQDDKIANVRLGVPTSILEVLLTPRLTRVLSTYHRIRIDIVEQEPIQLKKLFLAGKLDIMITLSDASFYTEDFSCKRIASEPYGAIMSINNPLALQGTVRWSDLGAKRLALPTQMYLSRKLVKDKLESQGVRSRLDISAASSAFLIRSTIATEAIAILPKVFFDATVRESDPVVWLPLENTISWNVEMVAHAGDLDGRSTVSTVFRELSESNEKAFTTV